MGWVRAVLVEIWAAGADFGECIKDFGFCREFNSNASDENAKGADLGECIKDLGLCREFNSNASDENAKVLSLAGVSPESRRSLGGRSSIIGRSRLSSRAHGT